MSTARGTYALILRSDARQAVRIGRWGTLETAPGYYVYVGSAFGPGGLDARVSRHFREHKAMRWHVDYLRAVTRPMSALCSHTPRNLEHEWAAAFALMAGMSGIKGFGSSDCRCYAHLFFAPHEPDWDRLSRALGGKLETRRAPGRATASRA